MDYETQIRQFILSEILADEHRVELTDVQPLITSGLVDSLGLLQILGFIQQKFGADLMATGSPTDFDSVGGLAAAVRRARNE
jgi:acyl carrier protein